MQIARRHPTLRWLLAVSLVSAIGCSSNNSDDSGNPAGPSDPTGGGGGGGGGLPGTGDETRPELTTHVLRSRLPTLKLSSFNEIGVRPTTWWRAHAKED